MMGWLEQEVREPPAAVVARIEGAETAEFDVWVERIVTAGRIEDVLGTALG